MINLTQNQSSMMIPMIAELPTEGLFLQHFLKMFYKTTLLVFTVKLAQKMKNYYFVCSFN